MLNAGHFTIELVAKMTVHASEVELLSPWRTLFGFHPSESSVSVIKVHKLL